MVTVAESFQERLTKAMKGDLAPDSPLGELIAEMAKVVDSLEKDLAHELVKEDPLVRSQISGRRLTGLREISQTWQRYEETKKSKLSEPEMIRQAAADVMMKRVMETVSEIKISKDQAQLFIQTLLAKISSFEPDVEKKIDEMKRAVKKDGK